MTGSARFPSFEAEMVAIDGERIAKTESDYWKKGLWAFSWAMVVAGPWPG